jgi:hypothetical protein
MRGGKYFNYYALCLPWIVMNFAGIVLDLAVTINYYDDYLSVLWDVTHFLDLLGVQNVDAVRPILIEHDYHIIYPIAMAMQIIHLVSSKLLIPLLFLFIFGLMSIKSMWRVVAENKRIQTRLARL